MIKKMSLIFLLVIISVRFSAGKKGNDWRPENRTGVSAETGLLKSWPETGPSLLWLTQDLPAGFSSVTFGKNLMYLTGVKNDIDVLVAIDTLGKIKWQTPYGRSWKESYPDSRCAATIDGNKAYVTSGAGDMACIDATNGTIIWSVKASEIYKGTFAPWGIAESVIIDADKLYYTPGGPETTTIGLIL